MTKPSIPIGATPLTIEDVVRLASGDARPVIDPDPALRARIDASVRFVADAIASGRAIYGITTGFGASAEFSVAPEIAAQMPHNLLRYHGCGTGRAFGELESAAIVAVRLASLARGWSAVRLAVLERMCALLERRILPVIPEEGSVGASGDLTPLSYVAALIMGEREALVRGAIVPANEALRDADLAPISLAPKESLAIMNGTSVMTALACLSWERSRRLARFASALTAMTSDVLFGVPGHFDDRIFALKPHPGQRACARWIREGILDRALAQARPRRGRASAEREPGGAAPENDRALAQARPRRGRASAEREPGGAAPQNDREEAAPRLSYAWGDEPGSPSAVVRAPRIQDRYSIRCAPHVIGVLLDALPWTRTTLETELNGVNDNPIIDAEAGEALHGGNFYGGHACFVTDSLKNAIANVADLLDRQLVLLNNPLTNEGLPPNLVARAGADRATHHGFKAMEITASALTAEALKLTMPASVFSRSTESHNQDKVSMGTISARDCARILELTETVAVIHLLALSQAVDLRGADRCHPASRALRDAVREDVPINDADRRMDTDIERTLARYRAGALPLGEIDFP